MATARKILVLGTGGREYALVRHLQDQALIEAAPGSDMIAELCPCWNFETFDELLEQIKSRAIDSVVVGPEAYLEKGISDFLAKHSVECWGPKKDTAQLETSKSFSKTFCEEFGIPTARAIKLKKPEEIDSALSQFKSPYVVKASGLAGGKGVLVTNDRAAARSFCIEQLQKHTEVLLEEYLEGEELSAFYLVRGGKSIGGKSIFLGAAQDHKRLLDEDEGPNTGGMGAFTPVNFLTKELKTRIDNEVLKPTLDGLKARGLDYQGFLFIGLMISKEQKPYVIEYNCRLGDPETQVILPRMKTNLAELLENFEAKSAVEFFEQSFLNVVISATGYPEKPKKGFEIELPPFDKDRIHIVFSGLQKQNDRLVASGGRLLSVISKGHDLNDCRVAAYSFCKKIEPKNFIHFRKDIGSRHVGA